MIENLFKFRAKIVLNSIKSKCIKPIVSIFEYLLMHSGYKISLPFKLYTFSILASYSNISANKIFKVLSLINNFINMTVLHMLASVQVMLLLLIHECQLTHVIQGFSCLGRGFHIRRINKWISNDWLGSSSCLLLSHRMLQGTVVEVVITYFHFIFIT